MSKAANYSKKCVFDHSSPGNSVYGENLAVNGVSPDRTFPYVPWKTQLDGWKTEETSWNCRDNTCAGSAQCGHLTAMIWKGTTTVGCGVAKCAPGTIYSTFYSQYIVCQYEPAGNYIGIHPITGVAPPCATCPTLPTPNVIPSSGAPTAPTQPPQAQPTAPLGTTKPKNPSPAPTKVPTAPVKAPSFPPAAPGSPLWVKCIGDYWVDNVQKLTPCNSAPQTFSGSLYCDVKDPKGYFWPVKNAGSTDCYYFASLTDESDATRDGLTTPAWIGIAVGSAAFIIIVIIVIIVIKKRSEDERV
jgi:hypothetical protein